MQVNPVSGAAAFFGIVAGDQAPVEDAATQNTGIPVETAKADPKLAVEEAIAKLLVALGAPDPPPPDIKLNKDPEAQGTQQKADLNALAGEPTNATVADLAVHVTSDPDGSQALDNGSILGIPTGSAGKFGKPIIFFGQHHDPVQPPSSKFGKPIIFFGQQHDQVQPPSLGKPILFYGGTHPAAQDVVAADIPQLLGIPTTIEESNEVPMPLGIPSTQEEPQPLGIPGQRLPWSPKFGYMQLFHGGNHSSPTPTPVSAAEFAGASGAALGIPDSVGQLPRDQVSSSVAALKDIALKLVAQGIPVARIVAEILPTASISPNTLSEKIDALAMLQQRWTKFDADSAISLQIRKDFQGVSPVAEKLAETKADDNGAPETTNATLATASAAAKAAAQSDDIAEMPKPATVREQVLQQVSDRLKEMLDTKQPRTLTIRLDPPELGSLNLTVRTIGQRVEATIMASNGDIRGLLEANKGHLVKMLESQGLEFGSMFVGHQADSKRQTHREATVDRTAASWKPEAATVSAVSPMPNSKWSFTAFDMTV